MILLPPPPSFDIGCHLLVNTESAKIHLKTIHKRNAQGETQLHRAAKKGDLALVRALIEAGIDVNQADYAGQWLWVLQEMFQL